MIERPWSYRCFRITEGKVLLGINRTKNLGLKRYWDGNYRESERERKEGFLYRGNGVKGVR